MVGIPVSLFAPKNPHVMAHMIVAKGSTKQYPSIECTNNCDNACEWPAETSMPPCASLHNETAATPCLVGSKCCEYGLFVCLDTRKPAVCERTCANTTVYEARLQPRYPWLYTGHLPIQYRSTCCPPPLAMHLGDHGYYMPIQFFVLCMSCVAVILVQLLFLCLPGTLCEVEYDDVP